MLDPYPPLQKRPFTLQQAVELAGAGDREAFRVLVEETSPQLFRMAARMLGSVEDAEDVLQESYVRAFDALRRGDFEARANLRTWLYRIVANAALDALRLRERQARPLPPVPEAADGAQDARAHLREVAAWMSELPPEQRVALVLKELEGLSSAAIAKVLGISEGAVEQRLVRARAALRERRQRD